LAIDFTGDWRAIFLMNFIKSARKVSYNTEGGSYMLTDPVIPNAEIDHITDEAFYLLKKIGCEFTHNEKVPVLEFTEQNHDFINEFKAAHKLDDKLVIGVYPVAGSDENKWDEEKYAELITRLAINYSNCIFIIFSEHNDKAITAKIGKTLKDNNIIDYLVVNKPLHELTLLANLSRLIICNDSNAAKMTAAYKQPALIIFGNEPAETADEDAPAIKKFISHNLEAKGYKPNAENISVEQVYNPAIELINNIINQ
jgi:ADP-heptose:LPS heptosyltransferase